jgi:hypothetical protein
MDALLVPIEQVPILMVVLQEFDCYWMIGGPMNGPPDDSKITMTENVGQVKIFQLALSPEHVRVRYHWVIFAGDF